MRSVARGTSNLITGPRCYPTRWMPWIREVPGLGGPSVVGKTVTLDAALTGKGRFECFEVDVVFNIAGSVGAILKTVTFLVRVLVHVSADQGRPIP